MTLQFKIGDLFPDLPLLDEGGGEVSLAELSGGAPLLLVFYRGPW